MVRKDGVYREDLDRLLEQAHRRVDLEVRSNWSLAQNVLVETHDAVTGELVESAAGKNLVLIAGVAALRDLVFYPAQFLSQYTPDVFAVGTGTTEVLGTDLTLQAEVFRKTVTQRLAPAAGQGVFRVFLDSTEANGSGTALLTEAGLLDPNGVLWARVTFSPVSKSAAVTLTGSWTWTIEAV